ncbi:hypothetical protein EJ110_NYTH14309 [Nymphaea thermarum]|nr:hypothetical protein EJ110_NYTH14309 [Nymphaea thermarum]
MSNWYEFAEIRKLMRKGAGGKFHDAVGKILMVSIMAAHGKQLSKRKPDTHIPSAVSKTDATPSFEL